MATNQPPFVNDLRTFFSPPSGLRRPVRLGTGAIDVARENAARLAELRRRATQGGTSPLRQGDNSVPMARPGSYPQIQMPNAPRPQQTYSGSVPSITKPAAKPSPGVNVPLPPSVYPDFLDNRPPMGQANEVLKANRDAARMGNVADTLQARREGRPARATIVPNSDPRMSSPENQQALAVLDQMAVDRREGDAARSRARAAFRAVQDGYANMTGGNSSLYDSTAVGNRSAVMAPARPGQMTTQQALDTAFDVRDSGIRGRGPYGGRPTYTQPGGMAGREAALAAPGALAPTTQMRAEAANAEADARRRARNAAAGRSPEDMGTRAGIGADYDGDGTISDNEMAQVEARMRERRAEREGFPTTREEKAQAFQAQRDRRRDRAQRAQEIMSLRSQMANTTTGRQAFGMGGNGFSPQMQYATTYQYNRPSLGQAAAMLDASRRRQDVLDRADEQQAFNNQLAVVTAMPEGPERTQALSRLQSQMQPSSGEVEGPASEVDTEIQGYVNSGNVPVAPALNARIIADIPVQERTAIAEQYASVMTSGMSNQAKRQFLEQQGIRTRDDMNDLQRGVPGYSTSGIGQYPLTKLYDEIYGIQTPSASIFDDNYDPSANLGR